MAVGEPGGSEVKDELIAIASRREEWQRPHAAITEPKPLLQPEMAAIYRAKGATVQTKRSPESDDLSLQVSMVAGACNQRYLQLWKWGTESERLGPRGNSCPLSNQMHRQ